MRGALGLLTDLQEKFDLNYVLAVDSEPFESEVGKEKILHIGTVGKLMPVVVAQGVLSHMKEPLKGINALSLLVAIASQLDLHPDLADQALGEMSPSFLVLSQRFEGAVRCIDRALCGWLFQCIAFEENTSRALATNL